MTSQEIKVLVKWSNLHIALCANKMRCRIWKYCSISCWKHTAHSNFDFWLLKDCHFYEHKTMFYFMWLQVHLCFLLQMFNSHWLSSSNVCLGLHWVQRKSANSVRSQNDTSTSKYCIIFAGWNSYSHAIFSCVVLWCYFRMPISFWSAIILYIWNKRSGH